MPELSRFYGIVIRPIGSGFKPANCRCPSPRSVNDYTLKVDAKATTPMIHPIYRIRSFEIKAPYTLRVAFDDGTEQLIDFQGILAGELFGPLRDLAVFNQVQIDPEVHTLVWPNGADFDPATLHDWPMHAQDLKARAERWSFSPI